MNSIYHFDEYRSYLHELVYGPTARRGAQVRLARAMGCQAAYLSHVLKGKAELTEDQGYKFAVHLRFDRLETEYFMVLLRKGRSSSGELRAYLESRRKSILNEQREAASRLSGRAAGFSAENVHRYFESWIPSTIHAATSSPKYRTPEAIAKRIGIPLEVVDTALALLHELGAIDKTKEGWVYSGRSLHFPKSVGANVNHQIGRRHQAIRAIEIGSVNDLHFSSIFMITRSVAEGIKETLLDAIKETHLKIEESSPDDLYGFCLDFFRIV